MKHGKSGGEHYPRRSQKMLPLRISNIIILLLCIVCMLLIILFITFYFDLDNLKYERDQLRMDNFIIQLMLSIQDNNDTFIKKNTNFDPSQFSWQHEISNDFYILRDTILGGVVYYIYFNNDIVLNINV